MRVEPSEIIRMLKRNGGLVRVTAKELGISPGTVINWRKRAKAGYRNRLNERVQRQSTKPHTLRAKAGTAILAREQDAILKLRRERGYGARKIKYVLGLNCHHNTIHHFLKLRGLTASTNNYRRPRLQETKHMYLKNTSSPGKLQMDIKYVTPELSGLEHTTYLYAIIDIYTRWKAGVILEHLDQSLCVKSLEYMLPKLPERLRKSLDFIQTDNGLEFQTDFHRYVTEGLGLKHHHTHKSSPNENAVIERSFRTDEEEFFWRIPRAAVDIEELNEWYAQYLNDYNTFRPHMGLNYLTPEEKLEEWCSRC